MEEIEIRLNDFLFNSGILGLYRILTNVNKDNLLQVKGNSLVIKKKILYNFENYYITTMLDTYEKDTKWYSIIQKKEFIKNIDVQNKVGEKQIDCNYTFIKKHMESNSYKAGYDILKKKGTTENPYNYIDLIKQTKDYNKQKELLLKIIDHIEENKEIYCMKDIIYTKINCFWNNVSFLNRSSTNNDIKTEYKKVFVDKAIDYIISKNNSNYTCIECGNYITKSQAVGMAWLNDVGIDIKKKTSSFWNFNEDTYICPICNLVYSCIPLGFTLIGSNGIFINNNESIKKLQQYNYMMKNEKDAKENIFENKYGKVLYNFTNRIEQLSNENMSKFEPKNIQIIKRISKKNKHIYEFNMFSIDKLEILKKSINNFRNLINSTVFEETLNNLIYGNNQYKTIHKLLVENTHIDSVKDILIIQLNSIGGINLKDRKQRINEIIKEGEILQKYFYYQNENENKLKSYIYRLQNALKSNNLEEFMKLLTFFYGSLDKPMPNCEAVRLLINEPEYFRLLGYSYIYGLQKKIDKKEELKGGTENE